MPPYFLESAALCALAIVLIVSMRRHRLLLAASGMLLVPFSVFALYHVPAFWQPETTIGTRLNPEDVMWTFAQGVLSVAIAVAPVAGRVRVDVRPASAAARGLRLSVAWIVVFLASSSWFSRPVDVMWVTVLPAMALVPLVVALRPRLWPLAVTGGVGYATFHALDLICAWQIWPAMPGYYRPESQLPWQWLGIPGFEWVFALVLGSSWPLAVGYICDLRLAEQPDVVAAARGFDPA